MLKRYQAFISSTFVDLKEERKKIMESSYRMGCIPVGMELFPASDYSQLEFIKKLIDESDFYIIVIAGRYGTIPKNEEKSFTEMEYDYAIEQKKPVIALIHNSPEKITLEKSDVTLKMRKKLEAFRKKIKEESMKTVQFWETTEDLATLIPQSIVNAMEKYESEVKGWTRSDIDVLRLSKLFNDFQGEVITTLPIYTHNTPSHKKMIAFYEVLGLMDLSNLLGKININLALLNNDHIISTQNRNEICIGGPLANEATNAYMKMYVPSFKCIVRGSADFFAREDEDFYMDIAEKSGEDQKQYFIIGHHKLEFSPDKNSEWGFILKIQKGYNDKSVKRYHPLNRLLNLEN